MINHQRPALLIHYLRITKPAIEVLHALAGGGNGLAFAVRGRTLFAVDGDAVWQLLGHACSFPFCWRSDGIRVGVPAESRPNNGWYRPLPGTNKLTGRNQEPIHNLGIGHAIDPLHKLTLAQGRFHAGRELQVQATQGAAHSLDSLGNHGVFRGGLRHLGQDFFGGLQALTFVLHVQTVLFGFLAHVCPALHGNFLQHGIQIGLECSTQSGMTQHLMGEYAEHGLAIVFPGLLGDAIQDNIGFALIEKAFWLTGCTLGTLLGVHLPHALRYLLVRHILDNVDLRRTGHLGSDGVDPLLGVRGRNRNPGSCRGLGFGVEDVLYLRVSPRRFGHDPAKSSQ